MHSRPPLGNSGPVGRGQVAADAVEGVKIVRAEEEGEGRWRLLPDLFEAIIAKISPVLEDEVVKQRRSGSDAVQTTGP